MRGVRSPQTVDWYQRRLRSLINFVGQEYQLEQVTIGDLRRWRASLAERTTRYDNHPSKPQEEGGLSSWTLYGYVRCARSFFRWIEREGLMAKNIAERFELPKRSKIPRKGIADNVADKIVAQALAKDPRDYAIVMFLADTAARVGGVVKLRLADLDLVAGRATVVEKGAGGHGLGRTVFLGPEAVRAMHTWLAIRPDVGDDHVFLGMRGSLTTSGIYQILKRLAREAGCEGYGWNPHNWRHAAARSMLQRGASLAYVSQILGHSDIEVTARFYATFAVDELQAAHVKYSRFTTEVKNETVSDGGGIVCGDWPALPSISSPDPAGRTQNVARRA